MDDRFVKISLAHQQLVKDRLLLEECAADLIGRGLSLGELEDLIEAFAHLKHASWRLTRQIKVLDKHGESDE